MNEFIESTARDDFNRARKSAFFGSLFQLFAPEKRELLSLHEVREALRPRGETYRGMQVVAIDKIVGSEGRYQDFTKQFFPRHEYLRHRWQSIDKAHLTDVVLPPISLYEIGEVYFVRDGNHRVSVAKTQGVQEIDAEVMRLDTEIPLHGNLTREGLRAAVIDHERRLFEEQIPIRKVKPECRLMVSATGRYDEIKSHIYGHKYYINEKSTVEIPLEIAVRSWYENVYSPIVETIRRENLMTRFPRRTETDLYLWTVRHWDLLKRRYGDDIPIEAAAKDYSTRFGIGFIRRLLARIGLGGGNDAPPEA